MIVVPVSSMFMRVIVTGVGMNRVRRLGAVVARRRRFARKAGARAEQRDQAGKNGPKQR